ncbi:MAG: methionine gamma-lyase family protein [Chitinophagales bacterium]
MNYPVESGLLKAMKSIDLIKKVEEETRHLFDGVNNNCYVNQKRVLDIFRQHRVSPLHFNPSTGYGYNDLGRETLESMYAQIFGGQDALVRSQIISGTHAIAGCLTALLGNSDLLVCAPGNPYDTLLKVITGPRGLTSRGIEFQVSKPDDAGGINLTDLEMLVESKPRVVLLQRSRGYSLERRSLTMAEIEKAIQAIKAKSPESIVLIDNCYGEFVETTEPGHAGADIIAGSLIKNPGGGLAAGGGYVVGKSDLVEAVADHLVAPGLGKEIGPSLYDLRTVYQGLFMAPHVVGEALKGAILLAGVMDELGFEVEPGAGAIRGDIVQAVRLKSREELERFVNTVQSHSPVDSHVRPEFAPLPGYTDEIIMAAGTFVQGSSIELSCDGPLRPPYTAFFQGGLSYQHCRYVTAALIELITTTTILVTT